MTDPFDTLPPFAGLRPEARRILASRGVVRTFEAGRTLWRRGAPAAAVYFVLDGEVKVVRAEGARQHVIHRGEPGATLGDVPLFTGGGYPATAVAVRTTRCLAVDRATLEAAIAADPALAWHFLENLAHRVRFLVQRLDERSLEDVRSRLLRHLAARAEAAGGDWFRLGGTHEELAEELGTVREVVARTLGELRASGRLESRGARHRLVRGAE